MDSFHAVCAAAMGFRWRIYADTHTTDQITGSAPTVEEQLAGVDCRTSQFGRSARASWGSSGDSGPFPAGEGAGGAALSAPFQDRVIKEMRLAGCLHPGGGESVSWRTYLPIYNQRFSVQPAQPADLHRPRPASRELDRSLCLKTTRVPAPGLDGGAPRAPLSGP